jgi:hypothetical protein
MKMKKLWALIMALAMALSLAVPAFADNSETGNAQNVTVSSTNSAGAIKITVPNTSDVILNPYQMKVNAGNADTVGSYHQVYSAPVKCVNKSTFGLKVKAQLTGSLPDPQSTANGEVNRATFLAAPPADTDTTNGVFLYSEFGVSTDENTEPVWASAYDASNDAQILIAASAVPSDGPKLVATLPAASDNVPNYLWYTFNGSATKNPTNAWDADDVVSVAVALTLVPTVNTVYNVNLTNTVSKTGAGVSKVSYDVAPEGETITVTCTPDATLGGTPTVTAKQGTTVITVEGEASPFTFTMPAGNVDVTVKWAA